MLLEDFNYFFNKSVQQFVNKNYNQYDVNQQTTDDLRVLKSTAILTPLEFDVSKYSGFGLLAEVREVHLPDDYLHLLSCVCEFGAKIKQGCYEIGHLEHVVATRLTADMFGPIINNYYFRPSWKRPYFYINNLIDNETYVTTDDKTDVFGDLDTGVNKIAGNRYGNQSKVLMEIRHGKETKLFGLEQVYVDYLRAPQYVELSQEDTEEVEDNSQILEFPDYVCLEIINILVLLIMENSSDPRIQTNPPINTTIVSPFA